MRYMDYPGYMTKLLNGALKSGADESEAYFVQGASTRVTVFDGAVSKLYRQHHPRHRPAYAV